MKRRLITFAMITLSFLLTLGAIASGAYFRGGTSGDYEFVVGYPSPTTIFAPRQILDFATTEENRAAAYLFAQDRFIENPIREIDPSIWQLVERNIQTHFDEIEAIRILYHELAEQIEVEHAIWLLWHDEQIVNAQQQQAAWDALYAAFDPNDEYAEELPPRPEDFTLAPEDEWIWPDNAALSNFGQLSITYNDDQQNHLLTLSEDELESLRTHTLDVAESIQTTAINDLDYLAETNRVLNNIRERLETIFPTATMDFDIANEIVSRHVRHNYFIQHERTEARLITDIENYERVYLIEGDIIASEGHRLTYREYRILEYLGYTGEEEDWLTSTREAIFPLIGMFLLTAALFVASIMYLYFYRPGIVTTHKEAALLFVLYVMVLVMIWVLREQPYPFLPILIFPMLVSVLIDRRCAVMLTLSVVFVGYFIVDGSIAYLLFYTISGVLVALLSRFTTQRSKIILVGLLVTAITFALSLAIAFSLERNLVLNDLQYYVAMATFAAINGLLVVIVCMGSLPFWEALFGVVTPIKLLDLTNPTNELLRRLTIEAPGTYHHSLMVANLAESAAYDIDANAHAARVGGYYHDVGKLKYPHFFSENIVGENPHDHMEPMNSVSILISHVTYGLTLAAQHRLPQFVRDIIREHHGTSLMQYFYVKARNADSDITEDDYRYPYTIPQTRESACVMLADTVEAAVRAMMPKLKSLEELDKTIRDLVRKKLNDGQLADSQLSIKDLDIIEASFARVLKSAHHERIAYPKLDTKKEPPVIPSDPAEVIEDEHTHERSDEPTVLIRGLVREDQE
ncbi:MAG: HDIG domain-containing protein [Defluviitaleaceae bacterium]|nr:HDIG domain-containing protein [Defluviitaleaceae bacterium]